MREAYNGPHHANACQDPDCEECAWLLDGHCMACDVCGHVGHTEADGWALITSGGVRCESCPDPDDGIPRSRDTG